MKEILFIRNNIEKWRAMEGMIDNVKFEMPDQLADAYTELTADLVLHRHIILIHVLPSISTNLLLHFIMKSTVINGRKVAFGDFLDAGGA